MINKQIREINESEFKSIIGIGEGDFCDYKSGLIKPNDLQETIVAFANASGGEVYVGINDKKLNFSIAGFNTIEDANGIMDALYRDIKPHIDGILHEFLLYKSNILVKISIPTSRVIHMTSKEEVFERKGSKNFRLNHDTITKLKFKKGISSFEDQSKEIDIELITKSNYFQNYLKRIIGYQLNPEEYLKRNNFTYQGNPKISSILSFCDFPQTITRSSIKIIRYNFQITARQYLNLRDRSEKDYTIEGPIEKLVLEAIVKINELLTEISKSYPKEAIQEAIVNAVIHRDYSISRDVHINIYNNCIEIISPGGFIGGINKGNILIFERHLRNPQITRTLFSISALQKNKEDRLNQDQGEGIRTIYESMRKARLQDPSFDEIDNSVIVRLWHIPTETYEEKIIKFLEDNESIGNMKAREITGEEDKERIKLVFKKLLNKGIIEIYDPSASKSKRKYKLVSKDKVITESNVLSLF